MKKRFWMLFAILWITGVFYFSSQSGYISNKLSKSVISRASGYTQISLAPNYDIQMVNLYFRKTLHFAEYAMLAILVYKVLRWYNLSCEFLISFLISFIFAAIDEFHQLYIPGRNGRAFDVFIDSLGALSALMILYILQNLKRRSTNER